MMKFSSFLAIVFATVEIGVRADECPRWITVFPLAEAHVEHLAADAVSLGKNTIVNGIAYMCNLTPEGDPVADRASIYAKIYRQVKPLVRAGSSIEQGVLLQATMGHGDRPGVQTPWQLCMKPNGDSPYRFCPLDARFLNYIARQCRTLSDLNPDFFMLDDDTRMVWDVDLPGCFCHLHLTALAAQTGKQWTRETVIAGLKAKDEKLMTAWESVQFDSLRKLYEVVRSNITKTVPGMICVVPTPAHFKHAKEIARILAAPGQTPTIRGGGAPYHNGGKDLFHVVGQRFSYARQLAAVGENVAYMMEADTCPRTTWATSATREYNELVMVALEGVKGAKMWITQVENPHETRSGKFYRKIFSENAGLMKWAGAVDFHQKGVVIPLVGTGKDDFGSKYLSIMGFPYRFGVADKDEVTALTADTVVGLSRMELVRILSGRVLVDGGAAIALTRLGLVEDIGVRAVEWEGGQTQIHEMANGVVRFGIARKGLADLNGHDDRAEVLTRICRQPHMGAALLFATPGSILYRNARGGKVLVLAQSLPEQMPAYYNAEMQSETYKTQMADWLRRLVGRLPGGVYYRGDGPVMCVSGETSEGAKVFVLDALDLDGCDEPEVVFDECPDRLERLCGNGQWESIPFRSGADGVCALVSPIRAQRPAVFRIVNCSATSGDSKGEK